MKRKLLLLLLPLIFSLGLAGCNNTAPNEPGDPTNPGEPGETKETIKYVVDFADDYINTTDTTSSKFNEVMVSNFNHEATILNNVTSEGYAQINDFGGVTALIVSSAKGDGALSFSFLKELVSITITASPYKKYIEYNNSYSIDENPILTINEEDWAFNKATETKELDKETKTFTINSTSLTISGKASRRVLIHSLEMEFVDEQD